jgi:hypothetical protein
LPEITKIIIELENYKTNKGIYIKLGYKENQKLSPFDMISLQFGKDKTKDRNDFLEKQKEYLDRYGPKGINNFPWLQSKEAKMARTYADLRDPRHDEQMLYKPCQ